MSKGQYFGEKELINGKTRENLARCKSRIAILYAFPNDVVYKNCLNKFNYIMNNFYRNY